MCRRVCQSIQVKACWLALAFFIGAPELASAQDAQLTLPPALRSEESPKPSTPITHDKKVKTPIAANKTNKPQDDAPLPKLTKSAQPPKGGVDLDLKWHANNGSGGNSATGTYNPWYYQGTTNSSQVEGGFKIGF